MSISLWWVLAKKHENYLHMSVPVFGNALMPKQRIPKPTTTTKSQNQYAVLLAPGCNVQIEKFHNVPKIRHCRPFASLKCCFSALTGVGGGTYEFHLFTAKGSEYNTANLLSKKVAGSRVPIMPILLRAVCTQQ